MSEMLYRVRLAIIKVWQQSDNPIGASIDTEKMARAALEAMRELPEEPGPRYSAGEYSRRTQEAMVDDALGVPRS
jgi:hypothetical protein